MPRGYRSYIVAALVGLIFATLIAGGYQYLDREIEKQRADYRYQPARDSVAPHRRVAGEPRPEDYQPNCEGPVDRENSDLCAQWSAVEAVNESNGLSRLSLWFGFYSLILTCVGTSLLVWTLYDTRRTSRRELRAYVFLDSVAISPGTSKDTPKEQKGFINCGILIKNTGQTPAYDVIHWGEMDLRPIGEDDTLLVPEMLSVHTSAIPPGGVNSKFRRLQRKITAAEARGIAEGKLALFVWGRVEYLDTFGKRHFTNYRMFGTARWPLPEAGNPSFCEGGNDAD